ncbi:hypothetical protein RHGRI_035885 [Rhododendron griersonianum]|uniref:MORF/ORRM1/DAG-like MORF domain-containing protein n=1 Tax=Rhododendron griersonianum TaxID=479676 RepID=A0AAV6HPY9_9ERIC|nr:hypothetical protein RHGRI_035885 [Rhododendron griersonianum]
MATTAAAATTIARSILSVRASSLSYLRFLSSASSSLSRAPPLPGFARPTRPTFLLSHSIRVVAPGAAARLTAIRCRVNRPGGSAYSPLNSGSNFSDRPPTEMAPLFPGCDYEHWLIVMDKPGGEGATKEQMIDCYVQTLAKVLGSEEEAKKKIYNVSCERYFGFGCEIDEETSNKLDGLCCYAFVCYRVSVMAALILGGNLNSSFNPLYFAAELFVNGEIVQRSPERQRRVEPVPQRAQDRPRYNDRTRYVRRRENMR